MRTAQWNDTSICCDEQSCWNTYCSSDVEKVPNTNISVPCFIYNPYLQRSINTWQRVCSSKVRFWRYSGLEIHKEWK